MEFRAGHASDANWRAAADACLMQLRPAPAGANLGFVYFTDRYVRDAPALLAYLKQQTGVQHWVGSSGAGVMGGVHEYMNQPALAMLVGALPPDSFHVFSGKSPPPRVGSRTGTGATASCCAIVHGDPEEDDLPALLQDMGGKVESGFLAGGLSSVANARSSTLQVANEVIKGGLSGVVLSSDVPIAIRLSQGCSLLGEERGSRTVHRVTGGERNFVSALDGRPALDVLLDDLGIGDIADLRRTVSSLAVALPVSGSDTGDFLVRNLVGVDPRNRLLAIGAPVEIGMQVMFCTRSVEAARIDLARMLARFRSQLHSPPRGGLFFSCLGRGQNLFGEPGVELRAIRESLGEFPLAGFFANGEISHDRLYAYTGVLVLFQ
jgi:small ligand-binding sensory domain FIST